MAAVQGPHFTVRVDLHQQQRDELLGDRADGRQARGGVFGAGPFAQVPGQGPVQSAQDAAEVGLVVRGLAEAAEDGCGRGESAEAVSADVAHHGPYAVLGGDDLVQVAADGGAPVGGELGRGDVQPVDARRQPPYQDALGGIRHPARLTQLTQQRPPDMDDDPRADRDEDGAGGDPCPQPVVLGERTDQLERHRRGPPDGGQSEGEHPAQRLPLGPARGPAGGCPGVRPEPPRPAVHPGPDADHAVGPPIGPATQTDRPRKAGPILSTG
ncbi:hypothetical protein GCM10027072_51530 [Streptomyces bullii]